MIGKLDVLKHLVDLIFLLPFRYSLEVAEYIKMFSRCQIIKQYVVLRADTKELSHIVHFVEKVHSEDLSIALRRFDETS